MTEIGAVLKSVQGRPSLGIHATRRRIAVPPEIVNGSTWLSYGDLREFVSL
jgi:hypothetical protein